MTIGGHHKRESNEALSNNEYAQVEEIVTTGEENISPGNFKSPNSQVRIAPPMIESLPAAAAYKT